MKGLRLRTIAALFLLFLLGASVLMTHVWKQNAYVRLSKEAVKLNRERKALRDTLALLEMEAGQLRTLGRLEGVARARFGLEYGTVPIPVYPEGRAAEARAEAGESDGRRPEGLLAGKAAWPTSGL